MQLCTQVPWAQLLWICIEYTRKRKKRQVYLTRNGVIKPLSESALKHQIRSRLRGVVKLTQRSTSFAINYHLVGVTGIVEFRKRTTDYRAVSVEDREATACTMPHTKNILYI